MTDMSEALTPTALPALPMPSISSSIRFGSEPKPVARARDMEVRSLYSMGVSAAMARRSFRYWSPTPSPSSLLKAMASSSRWAATEEPEEMAESRSEICPSAASWT